MRRAWGLSASGLVRWGRRPAGWRGRRNRRVQRADFRITRFCVWVADLHGVVRRLTGAWLASRAVREFELVAVVVVRAGGTPAVRDVTYILRRPRKSILRYCCGRKMLALRPPLRNLSGEFRSNTVTAVFSGARLANRLFGHNRTSRAAATRH